MKCETCKYWLRKTDGQGDYLMWDKQTANPDDFGQCDLVAFDFWQHPKTKYQDSPFFVMDGSDYRAELTTRRDFGCNQHEVKQ